MRTIQAVLTDYTKIDAETQTAKQFKMREIMSHPAEYRDMIMHVRDRVAEFRDDFAVLDADAEMKDAGIDDLEMVVNLDDLTTWLEMFISFVPGMQIRFEMNERETGELLDLGDAAVA